MSSDISKKPADVAFKPAGTGLAMTWLCMGCQKPRSMLGRRGIGLKRRCAQCIAKREAA